MSTDYADTMKRIVSAAAPTLRAAGFKKRRHSFNRELPSGIVHVVYFWQAPKEPPAWTEVPGLRERTYGGFRLDFGVWVPEITRAKAPRGAWINEYNCDLRATIGWLMTGRHDNFWWQLDDPTSSQAAMTALQDYGLPWLDRFPDQDAVLAQFEQFGSLAIGMTPAGPLNIAQIYTALERHTDERRVLENYADGPHQGGHAVYLRDYLRQIGHGDLADRVPLTKSPHEAS